MSDRPTEAKALLEWVRKKIRYDERSWAEVVREFQDGAPTSGLSLEELEALGCLGPRTAESIRALRAALKKDGER